MLRKTMLRWLCRFRYPVTLPEEVGGALGIRLSNWFSVKNLLRELTAPGFTPPRLSLYMDRSAAEETFANAPRQECFKRSSLFSYYLGHGWLEFSLHFDEEKRLRRVYVLHRLIPEEGGAELSLSS